MSKASKQLVILVAYMGMLLAFNESQVGTFAFRMITSTILTIVTIIASVRIREVE